MTDAAPTTSLTATARSDGLLWHLFDRHFDDAVAAVLRLGTYLARIRLPFDLRSQLRELVFPPQPEVPNGGKSFIYYYVPNSGWGSQKAFPEDPLHRDFVYCSDGIGLNLGCPVRLLRALDALARLPQGDQEEVREGLSLPTKHLATVEELLWLDAWVSPSDVRRGGALKGARGNVDWALKAREFPIYLEAKFRQSDWPRNTDQGSFTPIHGSFLGKAAHKFPNPPSDAALHLVAITVFENITLGIVDLIGKELEEWPQIHGVVIRSLAQMTHLLSIQPLVWTRVAPLLARPDARDYPTNYFVPFDIKQREARVAGRSRTEVEPKPLTSRVLCDGLQPRLDSPLLVPKQGAYRMNVLSRSANGEPEFIAIPRGIDTSGLAPDLPRPASSQR